MVIYFHFSERLPIDQHVVPNLRRLSITWNASIVSLQALTQLFCCDVFIVLTHFSLVGQVTSVHVVGQLLSILSDGCSYSLAVKWFHTSVVARSESSALIVDTFRRLNSRKRTELQLELCSDHCMISVFTMPRKDTQLFVWKYLDPNPNIVVA